MRLRRASSLAGLAFLLAQAAPIARAGAAELVVSDATTKPATQGGDVMMVMTITNSGPEDSLVRARCAAANFVEQRMVDLGEGAPSDRIVKALAIPPGTTQLSKDGPHIMLLQTTQALAAGDVFPCTLSFRDAGRQEIQVKVGS